MTRNLSFILLAAIACLCGCTSIDDLDVPTKLTGDWRFIYYEASDSKDSAMPAGPCDSIRFINDHQVAVRSQVSPVAELAEYTLSGRKLTINQTISGKDVKLSLDAYLADEDRLLVLRDKSNGAVFLRQDFVLPTSTLEGTWKMELPKGATHTPEIMELKSNGEIHLKHTGIRGSYRIWYSASGMMLSAFMIFPKRGPRTVVWQVERPDKDHLETQVYSSTDGKLANSKTTWRLQPISVDPTLPVRRSMYAPQ